MTQQHRASDRQAGEGLAAQLARGAIAGIGGTIAMTVAMRLLARRLPAGERPPLPPREIVERVVPEPLRTDAPEPAREHLTMLAHFGYGAATAALFSALFRSSAGVIAGAGYGVLVWALSYLGWIPGLRILKRADNHPWRRNRLMIAAHLVWGAAMALTLRELQQAEEEVFQSGPLRDASRDV